ncbi:MAG: hypothetical protein EA365_02320 [Gloeocapsa sp. DLM2.Bin57]|nr:MAG: hypothetical protein EA365_02320 [Gloeocapsa sp. DLM2.Bin57]
MTHSFLVETGQWLVNGSWFERNQTPLTVNGSIDIRWSEQNWFTMNLELSFPGSDREDIISKYRGHFHEAAYQYTYVLKQNLLGKIEGEGWIAFDSIVQRYWVIGDRQRRSGFETFYRINSSSYHLSGAIITGAFISSTIEATLERQS